jgi:DNA-binding NarL/FixJ family response regulator
VIRVLVVDDQALVRSGFRMILDAQPDIDVVGEAANGREAIELAAVSSADVILMDIRMPELDGIEATSRILAAQPETKIVILTTFDLDEYVARALCAGASGFLLKDVRPAQLVEAIRVIASGDALLAPSVTRRLLDQFASSLDARAPVELAQLTEREHEVLLLVAEGLSNSEIAERLVVGESTVKTHVSAVLRKLQLRDRVQMVIAAYDAGLVKPSASL